MKSILLGLLGVLIFSLLLFGSWIVVAFQNWPLWVTPILVIGSVLFFYGLRLSKRGLYRAYTYFRLKMGERLSRSSHHLGTDAMDALRNQWQRAIERLEQSSIKRFGNPSYALPWLLLLGPQGSGKTSFLSKSKLPSVIPPQLDTESSLTATRCGWWYFNSAVVIEASGEYAYTELSDERRQEWDTFLGLLGKARFKEGLSGIIITIAADSLLSGDDKQLEQDALAMRSRIEDIIRLFDMRSPVYVVITKSDLIFGFDRWAGLCSREQLNQAMGHLNEREAQEPNYDVGFISEGIATITGRLKQLRLQLAMQGVDLDSRFLLFPSEIDRLKPSLLKYLRVCFAESPYLEKPFFRGLFLTSAELSVDEPKSLVVPDLHIGAGENGRRTSLFIRDLLQAIIPKDRFLFLPTLLIDRWRQLLRNTAGVIWVLLFTLASSVVAISYVESRSTFNRIVDAYPNEQIQDSPNHEDRVLILLGMKKVVDLFDATEDDWSTILLSFSPAVHELKLAVKLRLVEVMQRIVNETGSLEKAEKLKALDPNTPLYGDGVQSLSRRITLRKARMRGDEYDSLKMLPSVSNQTASELGSGLAQSLRGRYSELYTAFIAWTDPNDAYLKSVQKENLETLDFLLSKNAQYEWLLTWADAQPGVKPVYLRDFWLPSAAQAGQTIRGALTLSGWYAVQGLLDEVEKALGNEQNLRLKRSEIEQWYESERLNSWRSFVWTFGQGQNFLVSESNWRDTLARINTDASPIYRLISQIKDEFKDTSATNLPEWVLFINEVDAARSAYSKAGQLEKSADLIQAVNQEGRVGFFNLLAGKSLKTGKDLKKSVDLLSVYKQWNGDLNEVIKDAITGEGKALKLESDFFALPSSPEVHESKLHTAYQSFDSFKETIALQTTDDEVVWQLLRLPLDLTSRYIREQAGCALQKEWERSVLWKTQLSTTPRQLSDQLYGEQGSVWMFIDGPAKPFLVQRADSFMASTVMDTQFPFTAEFIPYMNRAVNIRLEHLLLQERASAIKGQTANVTMTNQPVTVNKGAKEKPYAVIFSLQCSSGEVVLNNYNMASSRTFAWSPETCGDVAVEVRIGRLSLIQRYPGPMGLAKFMSDFRDGEKKFVPSSFPATQKELEEMGVQSIRVSYTFTGAEDVQQLARYTTESQITQREGSTHGSSAVLSFGGVPQHIAACWTSDPQIAVTQTVPQWISKRAKEMQRETHPPKAMQKSVGIEAPAPRFTKALKHTLPPKKKGEVVLPPQAEPRPPKNIIPPQSTFYIQIGVFRSEENVKNIQARLERIGVRISLEDYDSKTNDWIKRVKVGPFTTRDQAELILNRIEKIDLPGLIVRR